MTQRDRDRLVALKKAKKGLITQRQAAEEIGQSERHVRRLLNRLKQRRWGFDACSTRTTVQPQTRREDQTAGAGDLAREVYRGFGPTLAAEYLASKHGIH